MPPPPSKHPPSRKATRPFPPRLAGVGARRVFTRTQGAVAQSALAADLASRIYRVAPSLPTPPGVGGEEFFPGSGARTPTSTEGGEDSSMPFLEATPSASQPRPARTTVPPVTQSSTLATAAPATRAGHQAATTGTGQGGKRATPAPTPTPPFASATTTSWASITEAPPQPQRAPINMPQRAGATTAPQQAGALTAPQLQPRFVAPATNIAPARFLSPPQGAGKRQAVFKTPPFTLTSATTSQPMDIGAPSTSADTQSAASARTAPDDHAATRSAASPTAAAEPAAPAPPARYPPLVVEVLPDWPTHFRALKKRLGHAPNGRAFGKGVRFIPKSDTEYRVIQRYLTEVERDQKISWFSYSLPAERSLKVAIRGLPNNTNPEDIAAELRELGYVPELVRAIKARQGRPGCLFHAQLQRTPDLTPGIYDITELLCMPGVKIEAWRGKKGPAQCHRCQQFRHSSQNCHRPPACVRCGEGHFAADCPRPLEQPPTCANCGGEHTANNASCPVLRKEARNVKAGTVARTAAATTATRTPATPATNTVADGNAPGSLMAAANPPQQKRKRRRGRRGRGNKPVPAPDHSAAPSMKPLPRPQQQQEPSTAPVVAALAPRGTKAKQAAAPKPGDPAKVQVDPAITLAIGALNRVLMALQEGRDPVPIIIQCVGDLCAHVR